MSTQELEEFLENARLGMYVDTLAKLEVKCINTLQVHFDSIVESAKMKTGHKKKLHRLLQQLCSDSDLKTIKTINGKQNNKPPLKWDFQLSGILKSTLFGKVKFGHRRRDLFPVAVKVTDIIRLKQSETVEDPCQEAAVMQILGCDNESTCHLNLLRLVGVIQDPFELWIILEYAEKGELFSHVKQGEGFGDEKCVRGLVSQILRGVHHMHSHHVAHLDLSLENILLTHCPKTKKLIPKICDFGVARRVEPLGPGSIIHGEVYRPGKFLYMAPEVYRKEKYCPKAADVYSLGVVFFMLLTGLPPYSIPDPSDERFKLIADGNIEGIEAVLEKCKKDKLKISKDAIDVLSYMLCPSSKRYTAKEILSHPYFREIESPSSKKSMKVLPKIEDSEAKTPDHVSPKAS
mmetsp:Transcript_23242/g.32443  ORF Transcript_23242/g.32443 Transcript_23242/m.32443 type:complete len:404 (+) Transcript_23242:208-1419(+)|eukprot:CAMPEP_0184480492 /NCGR_PEP_ID=MMETSP0113_2-20130426/2009_1 /TAXON_ID=91329 /ORGANISM="Norrisiella sphaerica, Strain BC52" /LENGTH=403 /DNA_ID=CAMNT_0026859025 /DNA_START=208 /DNA_END=1419 /DNA_ORIENTATION=-